MCVRKCLHVCSTYGAVLLIITALYASVEYQVKPPTLSVYFAAQFTHTIIVISTDYDHPRVQ